MTRILLRSAAAAGVMALAVSLAACSTTSPITSTPVEGLSNQAGSLVAEGASSQQNAMDIFSTIYADQVPGATLDYNAAGSGSGRTNFIAEQVDFAGSDSPLSDEQVSKAAERCGGHEAWHLPFVIGPVAIAYNLAGVDRLNLDIPTLAKIFKGEITVWNDPAIVAQNAGTTLPDQRITVITRSDDSGTSANVQKFLNAAAPEEWDTEGEKFPVPGNGESANGSSGMATQVANIPGAITYVESGFAKTYELGTAALDFGSGPVPLSPESVSVALDNLTFKTEGHNMVVDTKALFKGTHAGSYPLILTTYEIVCSAGYDQEKQNQVKDFLRLSLRNQDQLEQVGFIPIAEDSPHGQRLLAAIDALGSVT